MEKVRRGSTFDKNIKQSLYRALKNGKGFRWKSFLGYDLNDIKAQLEKNFTDGMTWENYGEFWGVTFFIPRRLYRISSFRSEEFRKCWSLKNLKPDLIINCKRQRAVINIDDIEKLENKKIISIANHDKKYKILVVDDKVENLKVTVNLLNVVGFETIEAVDGKDAIEKLSNNRPDLILMDMRMPVMDGYTATREIRQWETAEGRPAVPIIALTAHALKEDEQKSFDAGCNGHLTKPIKKTKLLAALAEYTAD